MKRILPILLMLLIFAACDDLGLTKGRYTTDKDANGNFYVLDTKNGNVSAIQNGQLIKLNKEDQVAKIKTFQSKRIAGTPVEIGYLSLKFRNGSYYYRGNIVPSTLNEKKQLSNEAPKTPNTASKEPKDLFERLKTIWGKNAFDDTHFIRIQLNDQDGFPVSTIKITRTQLTTTVDDSGEPVYFSFDGSDPISPRDFLAIADYTLRWNLAKPGT